MTSTRKLWAGLIGLLAVSFSILLFMGGEIYRQAPPIPERVVTASGDLVLSRADIERGRQVWQSIGGHQLGSIWGHGGYVAPDWTADWLHREAIATMDIWARRDFRVGGYEALGAGQQAQLERRLKSEIRENTWDAESGTITIDGDRAAAIAQVSRHYDGLFGADTGFAGLREAYAMKNDTVPDAGRRQSLAAFYWWTAWAAVTQRPDKAISYTNNWPAEPIVGNVPPASAYVWTVFSVLFLIAGIGLLGWYYAVHGNADDKPKILPDKDPLASVEVTPSMRATAKYFWIVIALFLVQILLGAITAHYQVEGQEFYGFPISEVLQPG